MMANEMHTNQVPHNFQYRNSLSCDYLLTPMGLTPFVTNALLLQQAKAYFPLTETRMHPRLWHLWLKPDNQIPKVSVSSKLSGIATVASVIIFIVLNGI